MWQLHQPVEDKIRHPCLKPNPHDTLQHRTIYQQQAYPA